jgi:hypothetical protein
MNDTRHEKDLKIATGTTAPGATYRRAHTPDEGVRDASTAVNATAHEIVPASLRTSEVKVRVVPVEPKAPHGSTDI